MRSAQRVDSAEATENGHGTVSVGGSDCRWMNALLFGQVGAMVSRRRPGCKAVSLIRFLLLFRVNH